MESLTIGKVARLAEIGVETVRFYEREGLIDAPPRRESGYRQYPEETIQRLRFIKRAKELGFTLKEIKDLLGLRVDPSAAAACDAVRKLAEEKMEDVRGKIVTLQRMEAVLLRLVGSCRNRAVTAPCPILEVLKQEEPNEIKRNKPRRSDE
jgi:MerR family mercuric resistance operon transcriptional regulator